MIIGTAGFSWSGSSAICDLLMEFSNVQVFDKFEFLLSYYPDGLEDLDYHLNVASSKFLSSNIAIKRFRKVANYLLYDATNGEINALTDEYLKSITQVKWRGLAQGENLVHNPYLYPVLSKYSYKLLRRIPVDFCKKIKLYPISEIEYSILPDDFDGITMNYVDSVLQLLGLDIDKHIVLDQPFAGNNPAKSLKYFRDSKAIIVDRDPRELYLLAKVYFPKTSYQIPYDNVEDFISYYYNMHKQIDEMPNNDVVLYIKFEELIFEYEKTVEKIKKFLGFNNHINPKKYFKPEMSIANAGVHLKCDKYCDDIKIIERKLEKYLYDYNKHSAEIMSGRDKDMFDENPLVKNRKEN